jgi:hypothetical protein
MNQSGMRGSCHPLTSSLIPVRSPDDDAGKFVANRALQYLIKTSIFLGLQLRKIFASFLSLLTESPVC